MKDVGLTFSLRLPHGQGEPAHGLLARIGARYGVTAARLGSRFGLSVAGLTRGVGVSKLADLAAVDADRLLRSTPIVKARARRVELAGETLLLSDWTMRLRRWCPSCFDLDLQNGNHAAFQRSWWDVNSVALCPVHLTPLRDKCGHCGRPTGWNDRSIYLCLCGNDLSKSDISASHEHLSWSRYVGNRLGAGQKVRAPALDSVPLCLLPGLMTRFGSALSGKWSGSMPRLNAESLEVVRDRGLKQSSAPKAAFMMALDRTLAERTTRPAGVIGAYGWVYSHWLSTASDEQSIQFASWLRDHAIANGVIAKEEAMLGAQGVPTVTITTLAERLGLGFERTKLLVASQGGLNSAARRGVAASIAQEFADHLQSSRERLLTCQEAGTLLGVSKRVMSTLVRHRVLRRTDNAFDRVEVQTLAARLAQRQDCPEQLIALTAFARSGAATVAQLCTEILHGNLHAWPIVLDPVRLNDVGLLSADVAPLRPIRAMTIRYIARKLGLREDVTRYLARLGVLSDRSDGAPTETGIGFFERDFVTTKELANRYGQSARAVWLELSAAELLPSFGPPDCRQLFYKRNRAVAVLNTRAWIKAPDCATWLRVVH